MSTACFSLQPSQIWYNAFSLHTFKVACMYIHTYNVMYGMYMKRWELCIAVLHADCDTISCGAWSCGPSKEGPRSRINEIKETKQSKEGWKNSYLVWTLVYKFLIFEWLTDTSHLTSVSLKLALHTGSPAWFAIWWVTMWGGFISSLLTHKMSLLTVKTSTLATSQAVCEIQAGCANI